MMLLYLNFVIQSSVILHLGFFMMNSSNIFKHKHNFFYLFRFFFFFIITIIRYVLFLLYATPKKI